MFSQAQSLGDVAREIRAERQKSGAPVARVITNDDLSKSSPSVSEASKTAVADSANPEAKPASLKTDSASDREQREAELQRRTDAINQRYMEGIAALRDQLNAAQAELEKLQGSYEHIWELDRYDQSQIAFRYQQMLAFNQHLTEVIETQTKLVAGLKSQLENLQEEARHAGVPHATD
jgi:predicted RNase H-like nuclease (RuvC/YqgF family)